MSAVFTASKVRGRKYIAVFVGRRGEGDKNGAHKHLCSSVGGYGINPPPKGERICTAWEGEEKEKRIFSQILLEALRVEHFNSQEEKPLINRNNISNKNNFIFFHPRPLPLLPPSDIWAAPSAWLRYLPATSQAQSMARLIQTFYYLDRGDRGGDGVSIELPRAGLRTNPANGEADGWLTTSIDSLACPTPPLRPLPLSHLVHPLLIPVARSLLHHCLCAAL